MNEKENHDISKFYPNIAVKEKPNVKCSVETCTYHDGRYCSAWQVVCIDEEGVCITKRITKRIKR